MFSVTLIEYYNQLNSVSTAGHGTDQLTRKREAFKTICNLNLSLYKDEKFELIDAYFEGAVKKPQK